MHLFSISVCTTTLWVGHLSKLVQQEELSDTFGKYGDIISIDMIIPRGCAFIVMNRRQDAFKAMNNLKNLKMQGRAITISWAAGKGVKSKEWKDYWDIDLGVSYIPLEKIPKDVDFESLEEGGMFDEDSIPKWLKEKQKKKLKEKNEKNDVTHFTSSIMGLPGIDITQPPPSGPLLSSGVSMLPPFPIGQVQRFMPPPMMGLVPGIPMGVPPPQLIMSIPPDLSGPPPAIDKNPAIDITTSNVENSNFMNNNMQHPPRYHQIPSLSIPPPVPPPNTNSGVISSVMNDDHMDIEMEDDEKQDTDFLMFNKPPPAAHFGSSANKSSNKNNNQSENCNEENNKNNCEYSENRENYRRDSNITNNRGRVDNIWNDKKIFQDNERYCENITNDRQDKHILGYDRRLRENTDDRLLRRTGPPSLLDIPIKNDHSLKLLSNIWNLKSISGSSINQNNFQENRRNMIDARQLSFRNNDRDIFKNTQQDGNYLFKFIFNLILFLIIICKLKSKFCSIKL